MPYRRRRARTSAPKCGRDRRGAVKPAIGMTPDEVSVHGRRRDLGLTTAVSIWVIAALGVLCGLAA
jgi:hypothetical protein